MKDSMKPGIVVKETYTILEKLGEGAFSEVFLVRHKFLGLQAMKVFKAASLGTASDQFKEGFLLSRVGHPNVIRIFEANKIQTDDGERSYLTMEYLPDGTLHDYLAKHSPLPLDSIISIQKQICAGLSTAHEQSPPVVHRDIKPQNVLIAVSGGQVQVKIADFGLARNIDPKLRLASAAGTLLYMPPEGFLHYETPASDIYSAGIIFYEMLTGRFPFAAVEFTNEQEFRLSLAKSRAALPPRPSIFRKGLDRAVEETSLRALEPDMKKRYQSAAEFLAALETIFLGSYTIERKSKCASKKAMRATEIGQQYAELAKAISLLEEAIKEDPTLKGQYGEILVKWKAGVVL
jgi:serine/threonine protein kinase